MAIDLPHALKPNTTVTTIYSEHHPHTFNSQFTHHTHFTMAPTDLPANAHVSAHPCLQAKLSQLRSASTGPRDAQSLVHEIALMVGYEALGAGLSTQADGEVR
jgi:hypothetical protein